MTPVEVEASLRLVYATLDGLSERDFRDEIAVAVQIKAVEPAALLEAAESFGLAS